MTPATPRTSKTRVRVWTVDGARNRQHTDQLATEEPLEIRLLAGSERRTVAVTMRTPGADFALAAGFLFSEGMIASRDDIRQITYCVDAEIDAEQRYNIVNVALRADTLPDLATLERHFLTTSACGVCGKASLDALHLRGQAAVPPGPVVSAALITRLPERLRAGQGVFDVTGGLHAAGLFDRNGTLLAVREDVGRHNALDKLVGWALLEGRLPLHDHIVLVSGRVSFELVQKALAAGIPIVCAISAPSSLAVSLAQEFGMTLVGFLRGGRFNVYAGMERVLTEPTRRALAGH
ncbi:MAG: formate dehydrogenase accessory sulfurtransferase FdhD [Thermomicrobiales bacterium]